MHTPEDTTNVSSPAADATRDTGEYDEGGASADSTQARSLSVRSAIGLGLAVLVVLILGVRLISSIQTSSASSVPAGTAPTVGHHAPDFVLYNNKDQPVHLSNFQGKVVVLNFWYAGCPPCQMEFPTLEKTYQADAAKGVVIVGADTHDDAPTISSFTHKIGLTYPAFRDMNGQTVVMYGVTMTPTTFVIDRSGVVRAKLVGPVTHESLSKALAPLVGGSK